MLTLKQCDLKHCEVACDLPHDDPGWLEVRRTGIGASDMAAILGESAWGSALSVWGEKTGLIPAQDRELSEAVEWGNRLEHVILEALAQRSDRVVVPERRTLRSLEHPWALASLDGWTYEHGKAWDAWPAEAKAVGATRAEEWADGPPEHYRVQLHQQMLVTGATRATIAALIGGQRLVWCDVERDETLIRRIVAAGERFWEQVTSQTAPEPDGSDASKRALAALYPTSSDETIVLGGSELDLFEEMDRLKDEISERERRCKEIENAMRAKLGSASVGALPDGSAWTLKTKRMPARTMPACEYRELRRKAAKADRRVA